MKVQSNQYLSLEQVQDRFLNRNRQETDSLVQSGLSFRDILTKKTEDIPDAGKVRFSKHAANRLADRNIELTQEQVERLNLGVAKAGEKGINESLVLIDSFAFIVNVPNQTVITAMDQTEIDENIFTNIDGAVII